MLLNTQFLSSVHIHFISAPSICTKASLTANCTGGSARTTVHRSPSPSPSPSAPLQFSSGRGALATNSANLSACTSSACQWGVSRSFVSSGALSAWWRAWCHSASLLCSRDPALMSGGWAIARNVWVSCAIEKEECLGKLRNREGEMFG